MKKSDTDTTITQTQHQFFKPALKVKYPLYFRATKTDGYFNPETAKVEASVIHVLGVMHNYPLTSLPDSVINDLQSSNTLCWEGPVKEDVFRKAILAHDPFTSDGKWYEGLSEASRSVIDKVLEPAIAGFFPGHHAKEIKASFVPLALTVASQLRGMDYTLGDYFEKNNKKSVLFDSDQGKAEIINTLLLSAVEMSTELLDKSIQNFENNPLTEAYATRPAPECLQIIEQAFGTGNSLLESRNRAWKESIITESVKNQNLTIAVGAAHLVGVTGTLFLLQAIGYKLQILGKENTLDDYYYQGPPGSAQCVIQ
ncbi:MAG: hypothetical protein EPN84_05390 [Legionella sp.]|nr:MAG: hypothetical protein EPN84_05390 [Legionella sp.]